MELPIKSYPLRVALIAIAYLLFAWLGLKLAVPPGYATPIWPGSGIALAALLLWGRRYWPGAFLGSFLTNAVLTGDPDALFASAQAWLLPLGIGTGAALQALAGAWLIRRFSPGPWRLDSPRQIALVTLLGGPLACVLAASMGHLSLLAAGAIPMVAVPLSWLTWWVGDVIGVFLATPLLLILAQGRSDLGRAGKVGGTMAVLMLVLVLGVEQIRNWQEQRVRLELDSQSHQLTVAIRAGMDQYLQALLTLEQLFNASEEVTRAEFSQFSRPLLAALPGIKALEWVPRVEHGDRAAFEARASAELGREFVFTTPGPDGKLVPAPRATVYYPVYYLEPLDGNEVVLGLAPSDHRQREAAIAAAILRQDAAISDAIDLTQGGRGFLLFRPVLGEDGNLMGLVLAVLEGRAIFHNAGEIFNNKPLSLTARDRDSGTLFYQQGSAVLRENGWTPQLSQGLRATESIQVGGRSWQLEFVIPEVYVLSQANSGIWLTLVGGLLMTGIVGAIVLISTGQAQAISKEVEQRTEQLRIANEEIQERERFLDSVLENLPLMLFVKDAKTLRFVRINKAAEEIIGAPRELMLGKADSDIFPERDAAYFMGKDMQVLNDGQLVYIDKESLQTDRGQRWLRTRKLPLLDKHGQPQYLLSLSEDITELLAREEQIHELNEALSERNRELARANEKLQNLSRSDALTQLANRRVFDEELAEEWQRCRRQDLSLAVMMVDIDYFKRFNDAAGHLQGDLCLQQVAHVLMSAVRRAGDLVARYGGEEFALVLPGSDVEQAQGLAEKILRKMQQAAIAHPDSPLGDWVTLSIGIAAAVPGEQFPQELVAEADRALYQAKKHGRNRYELADDLELPEAFTDADSLDSAAL
ncbi:diguanylate cyclase [Gallaecimonas sp. GXIMD4217]|uniref:diguanylate cyclase domain-containing protein n=1 Tax=Gallaecimonas sp. GXIMD4217 TaxID=3131927 RepID=UPI00311B34DA